MHKKRCTIDRCRAISSARSSFSRSKKGQVTVFIIIGIVLVLALVLVLSLNREIVTFKPESIDPTQTGKVEDFITICLKKTGEDALFQVGLKSGYIDLPEQITSDSSTHIRPSPVHVIPYWAYGQTNAVVPLTTIKQRVDQYIEQNVKDCLFSLQPFQETYSLTEKSPLISSTEFADDKVLFNLNWDVEMRNSAGELVAQVVNHLAESPIKFKKVYNTATRIIEKELEDLKFEDITQDLISLDHPNVPLTGLEISCAKKTWEVESVKQSLFDLLRVNIRQLKIKGTDFIEFPKSQPYYQNHYVWDLGEDLNYPEISTVFKFNENHPTTFAVTPLKGTKLESGQTGGSDALSFLCIQQWKFTYDLVYPIVATVRDQTTGYDFYVAFTVHLVRNEGDRSTPEARPSLLLQSVTNEDYCQDQTIPITVKTNELVDNGEAVFNKEDLGEVDVSFTCLKYKCDLGKTDYNFANRGFAGMTVNFPSCVGGILRGEKEGYKEAWTRVVTANEKEVELDLVPFHSIPTSKITIVKHDIQDLETDSPVVGQATPMQKGETALIKLRYTKKNETIPFHESTFIKSNDLSAGLEQAAKSINEDQKVDFLAKADYTYHLDVTLLDGQNIVGGYQQNWTVPWNELELAQDVTIHVASTTAKAEQLQYAFFLSLQNTSALVPKPQIK